MSQVTIYKNKGHGFMHHAGFIAETFMVLARADKLALTHTQMCRLVYIAHGWSLGIFSQPLIQDDIYAMQAGPIIVALNHLEQRMFLEQGEASINVTGNDVKEWQVSLIEAVFESYKAYSGYQLSLLTRAAGTPWDSVWNLGQGNNNIIPNPVIQQHYAGLACDKLRIPVVA